MPTIHDQFPLFTTHPTLVYLDSAATTQKPISVIEAISRVYKTAYANPHRGAYTLSATVTKDFEAARATVASTIHANSDEIIFTSGATAGLNGLAYALETTISKEQNIVITEQEHHANLIPWQQVAARTGCELRYIPVDPKTGLWDLSTIDELIDEQTAVVSCVHVSNVIGTINPIETLIAKAKQVSARSIIDGCQAIAHLDVDVKKLDCDFYVFSGHKVYGPSGIGVLYGKKAVLDTLAPFAFGGEMISSVTKEHATFAPAPQKFEAGTPPIAQAIGLAVALDWFAEQTNAREAEQALTAYLYEQVRSLPGVTILSHEQDNCGVLSFIIEGVHPHDAADIMDSSHGVAVRAGHHCAEPLLQAMGITQGTLRASLGLYNTKHDVDALVASITHVQKIFA